MEFLFDDEWVDRKAGVQRVLGQPVKQAEPILQPEMPWEAAGVSAQHGILFDAQEQTFKLWYRARMAAGDRQDAPAKAQDVPSSEQDRGAHRLHLCYAESRDGVRWTRPSLDRHPFEGSRANNILTEIADIDTVWYNVIKDPDDPDPARRYKALGFDDCAEAALTEGGPGGRGVGVAFSPDGLAWSTSKLVMTTRDLTDADLLFPHRDPANGKWVAFFRPRTHPKRRFIGYSTSDDFVRWSYPRMLLTPGVEDDEGTEFYGLTATSVAGWRVGVLWVFHNNPEFSPMTTELVYSRDGVTYRRAMPGAQFLPLGPEGEPDSRMIHPLAFLERGAELFLYYAGSNRDHGSDRGQKMPPGRGAEGEPSRSIVGLARLPWGQFCGLRASFDGMVESRWLCNYGNGAVHAVAAIEKDGWVRAEILDQYGAVIPGWDRTASRVRAGEDGALHFSWGREELVGRHDQVSDAGGRIGHVVKLRFHLHRATLFGFEIGEEGAGPPSGT